MRPLTELRYAIRSLRQAGGFTTMVVLTLGLGLGLCVTGRYGGPGTETPRDLESLDRASLDGVVEHPIAWDLDMFYLPGGGHAELVPGAWVLREFMVRLNRAVTVDDAVSRVTGMVAAGSRGVPDNWRALLMSARDASVMGLRPLLQALGVAVLLVLLVSCGNVAGLLLIRAIRRQRELALGHALGARWSAIARMLLAEAVVIGAAAAILAIGFTAFALDALGPVVHQQLGRPAPGGALSFAMETRTLGGAAVVGIGAAVLCTLAPLVTMLRPRSVPGIQSGSRTTEGRGSQRTRAVVVALEIAASLALLTGSALMLRSVGKLVQADLGFDAERVPATSVTLRASACGDAASRIAVFEAITSRLAAPPRAESVALTTAWQQPHPARDRNGAKLGADAGVLPIPNGCFDTLGIPWRWICGDGSVASVFRREDAGGPCSSG
jgi:hypothetical protein